MASIPNRFFRTSSAAIRPSIVGAAACAKGVFGSAPAFPAGRIFRTFLFFLLLLAPMPNHANSRAVRVPFRTVRSMILIAGKINDKPVTFLLDTGSNSTIISTTSYGPSQFLLRRAQRNLDAAGISGESLCVPVNLTLANHVWVGQRVSVMNLDELQAILGVQFDSLLGEDILREFRSVRIDYKARIIELEQ
jgi:hypothetical protein